MDQFGSLVSQRWWRHSHWLCCLWSLAKIQSLKWVCLLESVQRSFSQTDGSQCCSHIHINDMITMHYNQEILSLTLRFKKQLWVLIILCCRYEVCMSSFASGPLIKQQIDSSALPWLTANEWNGFCIMMECSKAERREWRIWRWASSCQKRSSVFVSVPTDCSVGRFVCRAVGNVGYMCGGFMSHSWWVKITFLILFVVIWSFYLSRYRLYTKDGESQHQSMWSLRVWTIWLPPNYFTGTRKVNEGWRARFTASRMLQDSGFTTTEGPVFWTQRALLFVT